jgi:hypothetical protein
MSSLRRPKLQLYNGLSMLFRIKKPRAYDYQGFIHH